MPQWHRHNLLATNTYRQQYTVCRMQSLGKAYQWNHNRSNIANRQQPWSAPLPATGQWQYKSTVTHVNKYLGHHLAETLASAQVQRHHYSLVVMSSNDLYPTPQCSVTWMLTLTLSKYMEAKHMLSRHTCHWLPPSVLDLCLGDKLKFWIYIVSPTMHVHSPVSPTLGSSPLRTLI